MLNRSVPWNALNELPGKTNPGAGTKLLLHISNEGWASRADIEDIFYLYDSRLEREINVKALCAAFELPWRTMFYRPRARSNSVSGSSALAAADVAELLIHLERLGFLLDPMPLVEALLPTIKSLERITDSELSILWFAKTRHKMAPQVLQVSDRIAGVAGSERLRTSAGYVAEIRRDAAGQPLLLSVGAPRFRKVPPAQETICPQCGYTWYRGDPDSSANHRQEHKLRMKVLDPKPLAALINARMNDIEFELVTTTSPKWKHKEIYERAKFFRREFQYDFVQWESSSGDSDPNVRGFLFTDDADAIVGACAFRLCDSAGEKSWGLQWVWVCPRARRKGVLAKRWLEFKNRFGKFRVEGPVSPAMEAFVVKQGDEELLGYDPSARS